MKPKGAPSPLTTTAKLDPVEQYIHGEDLGSYPPDDQDRRLREFLDEFSGVIGGKLSVPDRQRLAADVRQRSHWLHDHASLKLPSLAERREMVDGVVTSVDNAIKALRLAQSKLKELWELSPDAAQTLFVNLSEDGVSKADENHDDRHFERDIAHYEALIRTIHSALIRMQSLHRSVDASGYYGKRAAADAGARVLALQRDRLTGRPHHDWHSRAVMDVCGWLDHVGRTDLIKPKGSKFRTLVRRYLAVTGKLEIGDDSIENHAKKMRLALGPQAPNSAIEG